MAYVTSRIQCASCGADLEIVFAAPEPGSVGDELAALEMGIGGTPIAPETTICPHCGGDIGDTKGGA